MYYLKPS